MGAGGIVVGGATVVDGGAVFVACGGVTGPVAIFAGSVFDASGVFAALAASACFCRSESVWLLSSTAFCISFSDFSSEATRAFASRSARSFAAASSATAVPAAAPGAAPAAAALPASRDTLS